VVASVRAVGSLLLLSAATTAPFQCASKVEPERRIEEEPAEALYGLAEKFRAEGNGGAREKTLRYLVDRFPASRFAVTAQVELSEMRATPAGSTSP
jgi:outer membrane protein assembly factor BamD (BamD/ComL family)